MASETARLALAKRAPVSAGFMALLAALSALAPMSLQIFVPALPTIQAHFAVSTGTAKPPRAAPPEAPIAAGAWA